VLLLIITTVMDLRRSKLDNGYFDAFVELVPKNDAFFARATCYST
jgi:hypothetical protein